MRKPLLIALISAMPMSALASDSYTIDATHTYPHFSISHLGFSTLQGRFDKTTGKVTLDRAAKTGSVDISIEAASISTGLAKRDDHLRGPDFFITEEFPTITYKSTKFHFNGDKPSSVEGNLTMLGVTKPVTLKIDSFNCGVHPFSKKDTCGAAASTQIKRSDFGMRYGLPGVGDDVSLVFEIEAAKD